ncbi:MAG: hypothetical protein OHK0050_16790 [Roseiflexaceae bacterium]
MSNELLAGAVPTEQIPVLALLGLVIYPMTVTPLGIAQEQSIRLIDTALHEDGLIVCLTRRDQSNQPGPAALEACFPIGTLARVHRLLRLPDGGLRVAIEGLERVEVLEITQQEPIQRARIRLLPDTGDQPDPQQVRELVRQASELLTILPGASADLRAQILAEQEPLRVSFLTAQAILVRRNLNERHAILAEADQQQRIARLNRIVAEEIQHSRQQSRMRQEWAAPASSASPAPPVPAPSMRSQLLRRIGDIAQLGFVRLAEISDGAGRGVRIADVAAGRLRFTVLIDRGLDIADASLDGIPLAWHSAAGITHPAAYEPHGRGWLRGFPGGLMTTCGFTSVGAPSEDSEGEAELHGRASSLPAHLHQAGGHWEGDSYHLVVAGQTREAALFGYNLRLTRRISVVLGETTIRIEDQIENLGYRPAPLMLLYHCNFGYPLIDAGARIEIASTPIARDDAAAAGLERFAEIHAPLAGYREQVFFHTPQPTATGWAEAAISNPHAAGGRGLRAVVRSQPEQLPNLVIWKQLGEGEYVVALEPANCLVMGRAHERERGTLQSIAPGEVRHFAIEISADYLV